MHLKKYLSSKACAAAFLSLLVAPALLQATAVIVPGGAAAAEGNLNTASPFNLAQFSVPSQRYQQVYSSTEFSALTITDILFRPDVLVGSAFSSTLANVRIDLSTTSAAVDGLSMTFANNVGADNTTVFNGALSLSSSFTGPAGGPKDFDIVIHLSTPFFYNPANGNLLMDVRNFSGGFTTQFDAANTLGDSVSRADTFSTGNVNSATADFAETVGLVTEFVSGVPEPASFALLLAGGIALAGLARRSGSPHRLA